MIELFDYASTTGDFDNIFVETESNECVYEAVGEVGPKYSMGSSGKEGQDSEGKVVCVFSLVSCAQRFVGPSSNPHPLSSTLTWQAGPSAYVLRIEVVTCPSNGQRLLSYAAVPSSLLL